VGPSSEFVATAIAIAIPAVTAPQAAVAIPCVSPEGCQTPRAQTVSAVAATTMTGAKWYVLVGFAMASPSHRAAATGEASQAAEVTTGPAAATDVVCSVSVMDREPGVCLATSRGLGEAAAMAQATVVGVDGCRDGWVAVTLTGDRVRTVATHPHIVGVLEAAARATADAVGIDMPIGLAVDGDRPGDAEARRMLGPRSSSLFPTPVRAVLDAVDYPDACARSRAACGRALSKQAWNLVPRIREVRAALGDGPFSALAVHEVHPETSFVAMTGRPMAASKKTAAGIAARLTALGDEMSALLEATARLADARPGEPCAAIDDVCDAAAAAWTARRITAGTAQHLGGGVDDAGFAVGLSV
jgi:predicted RNase H-like nuclease